MKGFLGRLPVLRGRNEVAKNVPAVGFYGEDMTSELQHYLGYVHRGSLSPQDAWDMYKRQLAKTAGLNSYAASGTNRLGEDGPARVGLPDEVPPLDPQPELLGWEAGVVDGTTPLLVARHGVGPTGQQSIGA